MTVPTYSLVLAAGGVRNLSSGLVLYILFVIVYVYLYDIGKVIPPIKEIFTAQVKMLRKSMACM